MHETLFVLDKNVLVLLLVSIIIINIIIIIFPNLALGRPFIIRVVEYHDRVFKSTQILLVPFFQELEITEQGTYGLVKNINFV